MTPKAPDDDRVDSGFTLIELLTVVVIIGMLSSIAVTTFIRQREKAWDAAVASDLRNAATASHTYQTGDPAGMFAPSMVELRSSGFRPSADGNYYNEAFDMTVVAHGRAGYCLTARSASGRYFAFSPVGPASRLTPAFDPATCG